jgi:hypothetical protein
LKFFPFIFLLFIWQLKLSGQVNLDYFTASEEQNSVLLKWSVSAGNTCNGISITRSSDGFFFTEIGRIDGVCGSPDVSVPYSFIDESPLANQINFYKLELGIADFSEVISIEYNEKNSDGYQLRPNPASGDTRLYFSNSSFEAYELRIYNSAGKQVDSYTTREAFIEIQSQNYGAGLYLFVLRSDQNTIKGKFIVFKD